MTKDGENDGQSIPLAPLRSAKGVIPRCTRNDMVRMRRGIIRHSRVDGNPQRDGWAEKIMIHHFPIMAIMVQPSPYWIPAWAGMTEDGENDGQSIPLTPLRSARGE